MLKNLFSSPQQKAFSAAEYDADTLDILQLIRTENIGPITFYNLVNYYDTAAEALIQLPEIARRSRRKKPYRIFNRSDAEAELEEAAAIGAKAITINHPDYPEFLRAVEDAPPLIYVLGNPARLSDSCLAMVGARNASANGQRMAEKIARELGLANHIVVSGLARGIDTAAHKGSIETGTVAVIAGGIDNIYPEENTALYHAIAESGAIVSENPPGMKPQARHFPRRNRIISGLSKACFVVEASVKSGSLITARYAMEQGRDVMAVPGFPMDPRAGGPNKLIQQGAKLVTSANDILEELSNPVSAKGLFEKSQENFIPSKDEKQEITDSSRDNLINLLSFTPTPIDDLIAKSSLTAPQVLTILLEMEIAGTVTRHSGNRVSRNETDD